MAKYNLIIADSIKEYMDRLAKYLISRESDKFIVNTFTNKKYIKEYLKINKVDIFLVSPDILDETFNLDNVVVTILNIADLIPSKFVDFPYINKYKPGNIIANELIRIFAEYSEDEIVEEDIQSNKEIIGVYSPIGGVGKTTIAIAIAKSLAVRGKKTLFLSMEQNASYNFFLKKENKYNFSDFLYYLKQNDKKLLMKVQSFRNVDSNSGIHYFSPPICYNDLNEINVKEWSYLFNYIRDKSSYSRVIIDFSSHLSERNIDILNLCNKIILIVAKDPLSVEKIDTMNRNLDAIGKQVNDKVISVVNRDDITDASIGYSIPFDTNLICNDQTINLNSHFGQAINYIAKEL